MPFPKTDETDYSGYLKDIETKESGVLETVRKISTDPVHMVPETEYHSEMDYFTEEDAKGENPQEYRGAQEKKENLEATLETGADYSIYGMILEYKSLFEFCRKTLNCEVLG